MASVVRVGDMCTGHSCFPPRKSTTGSSTFFIDSKPAVRVGDMWETHVCGNSAHSGIQETGSSTFFSDGKAVATLGKKINCGSYNAQGSPTFFTI